MKPRVGRCAIRSGRCSTPLRSGAWCTVALLGSDDAVAHMICLTVTTGLRGWPVRAGPMDGRGSSTCRLLLACGPAAIALALQGTPYYIGMAIVSAVFFLALRQISIDLQRIFVRAHVSAGARGGAGQSVRYRAEQYAAWSVHVWGRRPACGDELSFQRNDGAIRRSRAKRRAALLDIIAACVSAGSISAASGKIILAEIANSQARGVVTADPDFARNRSLSWTFQPMAGGGAVVLLEDITERRNAEARISHLARYDELSGAAEPGQFPRRDVWLLADPSKAPSSCRRCCSLTSTSSSRSTTRSVTPAANQPLCAVSERLREMLLA